MGTEGDIQTIFGGVDLGDLGGWTWGGGLGQGLQSGLAGGP